jgi:Zn2+/Cd2+-exporting ATPase
MTDSANSVRPHDQPKHNVDHAGHDHSAHAHEDTQLPTPIPARVQGFRIATIDCAAEESEIRRAIEPIEGVRVLAFNWAKHARLVLTCFGR